MSRQVRITYPGAFYHVYSRGNQKQAVYFSDADRCFFLKILRDAHERYGAMWHLYCLMDSHYHLGLETPEGNLSQIMHFVNSAYSIYVNLKHERCGHLFQGRFKAVLVQADLYARTLTKYIHANPVRKGIVASPEEYEWSSCKAYFGQRKAPSWLSTRAILTCFGGSPAILRREHEAYLAVPGDRSFDKDLKRSSRIGILGDDDFVDRIRRSFLKEALEREDDELSGLKKLRAKPELGMIRDEVQKELGDGNKLAKKCVIFLARQFADYRLREIGDFFDVGPAAVSIAFRKIEKELLSNETLKRCIERIRSRVEAQGPGQNYKI